MVVEFRYAPPASTGCGTAFARPTARRRCWRAPWPRRKSADAVFLMVGETSNSSVESKDRPDTRLAAEQIALIEAVCAANPRTAAIVQCRPRLRRVMGRAGGRAC